MLVARDPELATLEQLLHVGGEGPPLVLVTGAAGVGKTALLDAVAARHHGPSLRARAARWECDRPFGVLEQMVGDRLTGAPLDAAEQLVLLASGESGAPALLVVDDAQWSDHESLQTLSSAVQHHREGSLLVLVAADLGGEAPAGRVDLLRRVATTEVALSAFDAEAVGELAAAHGVLLSPMTAERLCRHTGGVARHVVDLLVEVPMSTWAEFAPTLPAPAPVAARVREAMAGCTERARRFARAVAVLGPRATVGDVAVLADLDDDVFEPLDEVHAAGLVALDPRGPSEVSPSDPMVRAALLSGMGPAAAARAHRRAAGLVEDPVERLRLLVSASPMRDSALADELEELATERAAQGAWAVAASLLIDASRLTEERLLRERRLTRAVDALIGAGDALGAAALTPEVESLRETPMRNAVLGYLAIIRGRASEAENRLGRAWELVSTARDPEVAAVICQRYVLHELSRCRGEELLRWADRAIELADTDDPAAVEAAAIRGLGLAGTGRVEEALVAYEHVAEQVQHGAQAQRVSMARGWLSLTVDAVEDARAYLETAVPTTYLGGSTRISLWARAWLARAHFVTGDWDEALDTVREGVDLLDRTGMTLVGPLLHWTAVQVHALRGDWGQALEASRRADAGPRDYEIMRVPSSLARAQVAEARADYAAVLRALRPLTQPWAGGSIDEPGQWPWADVFANALVIEGRLAEADAFLTPHEVCARDRGHHSARARLGYARGRLLGAQGEIAKARSVFEESLALLESLPLSYDRARVNFAYGQTLRRAGKRRQADAVMSTARDIYAALGAATYVSRCDRELRAGGVRAPRGDRGIDELTPQEDAVTQLVAKGLSNREVAAELFLSTKTVQYHLTRVYAKLGIRSRSELAALRGPTSESQS